MLPSMSVRRRAITKAAKTVPKSTAPMLRARKNPVWLAIGILAICLGALGAGQLVDRLSVSNDVLVTTKAIARGDLIQESDIRAMRVGDISGISAAPQSELKNLVGQLAQIDMAANSIVPEGAAGEAVVPAGSTHLGLSLGAGRMPSGFLPAGTRVLLVAVSPSDEKPVAPGEFPATVVSANGTADDSGARLVDVSVKRKDAATVAELAATDRIVLVRLP